MECFRREVFFGLGEEEIWKLSESFKRNEEAGTTINELLTKGGGVMQTLNM